MLLHVYDNGRRTEHFTTYDRKEGWRRKCFETEMDLPSPILLDGRWASEGRNQQSPGRDNMLHGPMTNIWCMDLQLIHIKYKINYQTYSALFQQLYNFLP